VSRPRSAERSEGSLAHAQALPNNAQTELYRERGAIVRVRGYQFDRAVESFVDPIEACICPPASLIHAEESREEGVFLP
jgi:hypothetical protein